MIANIHFRCGHTWWSYKRSITTYDSVSVLMIYYNSFLSLFISKIDGAIENAIYLFSSTISNWNFSRKMMLNTLCSNKDWQCVINMVQLEKKNHATLNTTPNLHWTQLSKLEAQALKEHLFEHPWVRLCYASPCFSFEENLQLDIMAAELTKESNKKKEFNWAFLW